MSQMIFRCNRVLICLGTYLPTIICSLRLAASVIVGAKTQAPSSESAFEYQPVCYFSRQDHWTNAVISRQRCRYVLCHCCFVFNLSS